MVNTACLHCSHNGYRVNTYRRTSSQKPGDEFIANFRQTFPEVSIPTSSAGPSNSNQEATAGGSQLERYAHFNLRGIVCVSLANSFKSDTIAWEDTKISKISTRRPERSMNHGDLLRRCSIQTPSRSLNLPISLLATTLPLLGARIPYITIKLVISILLEWECIWD